ncbi:DUF2336 domain-containing protein [Methylobacterium sp. A54F]
MPSSAEAAPDLSGLIELSRSAHLDLKPVILRVQTDLFVQGNQPDRAAFESLACGLIPTVDEETALIVARKLSPCPETPHAVLAKLAARGGAIRDAVVAQAPSLDGGILEAALADGSDIAAALAARDDLTRATVADLAGRGDPAIDRALAANAGLALRGESLAALVGRGCRDADLAGLLLGRADLDPADLAPLYLHADPGRREAIRAALARTAALRPCPPAPREIGAILTGLSAAHDVKGFIQSLADGLGLPANFLNAAPDAGTRYELLTLGLRAADLHEEEAVYIFLTLNEGVARSAERVFDLVRLFRTTSRPAARDLLSAILDAPMRERAGTAEAHTPHHAPEAPRVRAGAERPAARPRVPITVPVRGAR